MRRSCYFVVGVVLCAIACSNSEAYSGGGFVPGGSSSSGPIKGPPPDGDDPLVLPRNCADELTTCGQGCCAPGSLCLFDACVTPGLSCEKDADCTDDRYCESSHGKCFPRVAVCEADAGVVSTCLDATCSVEKSALSITSTKHMPCDCDIPDASDVGTLRIRVQNRGRTTVPAGVVVRAWEQASGGPPRDGGTPDAYGSTQEALIPGQSTDVVVAWPLCAWFVTIDTATLESFPDDCNEGRSPVGGATECTSSGNAGGGE